MSDDHISESFSLVEVLAREFRQGTTCVGWELGDFLFADWRAELEPEANEPCYLPTIMEWKVNRTAIGLSFRSFGAWPGEEESCGVEMQMNEHAGSHMFRPYIPQLLEMAESVRRGRDFEQWRFITLWATGHWVNGTVEYLYDDIRAESDVELVGLVDLKKLAESLGKGG